MLVRPVRFIPLLLLPILHTFPGCDDRSAAPRAGVIDASDQQPRATETPRVGAGTEDAGVPCQLRPWSTPRRVDAVNTSLEEGAPTLTPDELSIVFHVRGADDAGARSALWTASRASRDVPFSTPERLEGAAGDDAYPTLTSDGMTLVFARRVEGEGPYRLFRSERPELTVAFGVAKPIADDAAASQWPEGPFIHPFLTPDRTALYFSADPGERGAYGIYRSNRLDDGELAPPVRDDAVDDAASSLALVLSMDRLTLFVSRRGAEGGYSIHSATRSSAAERFGPLLPVDVLNAGATDTRMGWLSADGCRSYLARSSGPGSDGDIYSSERE